MRKIILTLLTILLFTLPVICLAGSLQEAQKAVIAKKNAGAPACSDHVITLSGADNVQTVGDGTNGNLMGGQITPPNNGTIKAIGVGSYSDGTAGTWTLVWKKNATSGYDLSSGTIDTLTSGAISSSQWVDFDVTDTAITTSDTFTVGLMTNAAGYSHLKVAYTTNGSSAEVTWANWGGNSWVLDDNEFATKDFNIRYTLCY
jgi:hypothetical protein